jgi:hypothetical protein
MKKQAVAQMKEEAIKAARAQELQAAFEHGYRSGGVGACLWAADEINRLTDMLLRSRDEILKKNKEICQSIADKCGKEIHTAVAGVSVQPRGIETK